MGVHAGRDKTSNVACLITMDRFRQLYAWLGESKSKKAQDIIHGKGDEMCIKSLNLQSRDLGKIGLDLLLGIKLPVLKEINL